MIFFGTAMAFFKGQTAFDTKSRLIRFIVSHKLYLLKRNYIARNPVKFRTILVLVAKKPFLNCCCFDPSKDLRPNELTTTIPNNMLPFHSVEKPIFHSRLENLS